MTDKTIVDVADKAVDKLSGGVEALAKQFSVLAPKAWEALVRQQVIEGAVDLALCVAIGVAAAIFCPRLYRRAAAWHQKSPYGGGDMAMIAIAIVGAFVALVVVVEGREAALQLGNPQYYAAKALAEMVK